MQSHLSSVKTPCSPGQLPTSHNALATDLESSSLLISLLLGCTAFTQESRTSWETLWWSSETSWPLELGWEDALACFHDWALRWWILTFSDGGSFSMIEEPHCMVTSVLRMSEQRVERRKSPRVPWHAVWEEIRCIWKYFIKFCLTFYEFILFLLVEQDHSLCEAKHQGRSW